MKYNNMTQKELIELCRRRGIKANNKMSKAKLMGMLIDDEPAQASNTPALYRVATSSGAPLNVRALPNKSAPVMWTIENGTEFEATPCGDWLELSEGYVLASLTVRL